MLNLKRWTAAVLCAALGLGLSACTLKTPANVMTVDGVQVPAGVYLMYQLNAYTEAESLVEDGAAVQDGQIEGQDAVDWVHEKTVEDLRRWVWIDREFEAQGLKLEGDGLTQAQSQAASNYEATADWYADNGIGAASYETFYLTETKYQMLYEAWAETAHKISLEDAEAYMDEHYVNISSLVLPVSDDEGNQATDEARNQIDTYARELTDALNAGGTLSELAGETVKKACEAVGRTYDEESTLSSLMMTGFASDDSNGYFSEEAVQALRDQDVGYAMLQTELSAPVIYQRVANYADDEEFESTYYVQIENLMKQEQYQQLAAEGSSGYAVEEDASAVKTYAVKNIKEME